jgi:hypothetical protein
VLGEQLWARYLPGLIAAVGGAVVIAASPRARRITATVLATLLGLVCMEAEYWIASGFPASDMPFFLSAVAVTMVALAIGNRGTMILGVLGLLFFAYVNLRYGAPYILDYIMPVFYALLIAWSRRALNWARPGIFEVGRPETVTVIALEVLAAWRTTDLDKWGWIAGRHWR